MLMMALNLLGGFDFLHRFTLHLPKGLKVAFSTEPPDPTDETEDISCRNHCVCPPGTARKCTIRRDIPGSTAFVPSSMGLLIASEVVRALTRNAR